MAAISPQRESRKITDQIVMKVCDNLELFINGIRSIDELFVFSEMTIRMHYLKVKAQYEELVGNPNPSQAERMTTIKRKKGILDRSLRAKELMPSSYFVSIISMFDSFIAGLVRCIYDICPEKLKECEKTFTYTELDNLKTFENVRKTLVDKKIESLLRDSHIAQIEWLAKTIGVRTLKEFDGWRDFVEMTERRNLFVHSNGVVSSQYLHVCMNNGVKVEGVVEGFQLSVDEAYFDNSYKTLYQIAIMLSQMVLRCLYAQNKIVPDIDAAAITSVFDLIVDEQYEMAIIISKFLLENHNFKYNEIDKCYLFISVQ